LRVEVPVSSSHRASRGRKGFVFVLLVVSEKIFFSG